MPVAEVVRPDLDFALHPLPDLYDVLEQFRALGPAITYGRRRIDAEDRTW